MPSADATTGQRGLAASDMTAEEFRAAGHRLIDELADFYASLPERSLTSAESAAEIRQTLVPGPLPRQGRPAAELIAEITPVLFDHSMHNGHPRFLGYITSSAAPLGALADLLAAGINQNCGLRQLSPAANEIEQQAIAWLAELIGYPLPCGGIMVSGGNVANILGFIAARQARLPGNVRRAGVGSGNQRPRAYCSREAHTWIEKAADIAGLGTDSIRWIATDSEQRLDPVALETAIDADRKAGDLPFILVGTSGQVSTGAIDPLPELAAVAERHGLWYHIDGAYGAPAACLPEAPEALKGLALADSLALDPHKWLYAPIEVACTLVRNSDALKNAFSYRPPYYRLGDARDVGGVDYFEHGLQNSRGFRALKVWLCLRQAGRDGYEQQIRKDIALARQLFERACAEPELEAGTQNLSITTLRYRPENAEDTDDWNRYLDQLNESILTTLQSSGEAYVSNAIIGGRYFLRACVVNFRTRPSDMDFLADLILRLGRNLDASERQR